MAYTNDLGGPYPNKAGEFCGNHLPGSPPLVSYGQDLAEAVRQQEQYLARMRFGKPGNCKAGTSEEMAAKGWVGLYFKEDPLLHKGDISVETDALTEAVVSRATEPD